VPWGRPYRTAIPTLSLCATFSRPPRRPPNDVTAIRAQRRPLLAIGRSASPPSRRTPAMPRLYCLALALVCKEALNLLELGYKAGRPSPRASTEPPPSAIGAVPVNSTSGCLSSQTRATPHSPRTPVAPTLACWPARAAGSPEPVSLRPPPGSHRRAMLSARSPCQPTISTHPLGPSAAARATR
jgi:hypothetical protein